MMTYGIGWGEKTQKKKGNYCRCSYQQEEMKVKAEVEGWNGAENKCETDRRQKQQMDQEAVQRGRGT